MSNAKWRKLIGVLHEKELPIIESHWKFLGDAREYVWRGFPTNDDTSEVGLKDGRWPPIAFKEIFRITIPRECDHPNSDPKRRLPLIQQPVDELFQALKAAGKFPIRVSESGLEITAYAY